MNGVILVVDDHVSSRDALGNLLRDADYTPLLAGDAATALEHVRHGGVDLVLLDVGLPRVSGLDVLTELRRKRSSGELPVIMVTAASESTAVVEALRRGANDYVTKPLDFDVLLARVQTQLQLSRLSKLKDQFLRIASHDLKNPLTVIMFGAESLKESFPVGAPMTEEGLGYLESMAATSKRMQQIIAAFLDLGALRDGHLELDREPLDLRELATRSIATNGLYARKKSIGLTLAPGTAIAPLLADAARLTQVIDNLVSNAVKFTPPGGAVTVAVDDGDGGARLEVRDSGPGLSEEDLAKLFAAHARGSNRPTGGESSTGLGLALCKQLVELHGGRIGARNGETGGAVFWFEVPRTSGHA